MTTTEIAHYEPQREVFPVAVIEPMVSLAGQIAKTEFVPSSLRGRPEAILACFLTGHELSIGPMQSLSKIHIIEGRPAMSAELMRALVQREGHELWFEDITTTRVTACGRRRDSQNTTKITWTLDDAKKAGLEGKQNWRKFPRQMLTARATGEICRLLFADVLGGISYTPEELGDGVIDATVVDVEPAANGAAEAQPAKRATRKAAPARKAAEPGAPAAERRPAPEPELPPLPGEEAEGTAVDEAETGEKADDAEREAVKAKGAVLDAEHTEIARKIIKAEQIPPVSSPHLTKRHVERLNEIVDRVAADQKAVRLKRQKAANARMGEVGVTSDDVRHDLVREATGGETESTGALTQAQLAAVLDYCDSLKQADGEEAPPAEPPTTLLDDDPGRPFE